MQQIPLTQPLFSGNEIDYVTDCLKTTWVSAGKYNERFEEKFAAFCNTTHACTSSSGTSALHMSAIALKIKSGDEVIVPDLTYVSSSNIVSYIGAKPVLVDVDRHVWTLDPSKIEEKITKKTKAIIVVHLYGHPTDMDKINDIAKKYRLFVIEDACEAHGSLYKGKKAGSLSDVGCFSFSGAKIITTGEGGMVVSSNTALMDTIRAIQSNYMDNKRHFFHTDIGYPYRYSNLQAALGLAQLEKIDQLVDIKIKNAKLYNTFFKDIQAIQLPPDEPWAKSTFWLYGIVIKKPGLRDKLMQHLKEIGIQTRPFFASQHKLPMYKNKEKYPNSEYLSENGVCLPSGLILKPGDIEYICTEIIKFLKVYA